MSGELQYLGNPDTDTGFTVTADVYDNAGVLISESISCSEVGALSIYIGDMPTAAAGLYSVRFFNGATFLNQGTINWDGAVEIYSAGVTVQDKSDIIEGTKAAILGAEAYP